MPVIFIYCVIGIIIMLILLYSFIYEPLNFTLSEVNIFISEKESRGSSEVSGNKPVTDLNKYGKPLLTILHLSDFHLRKNLKGRKLFKFVRDLSHLRCDFIFITGDLLGGSDLDYIDYLVKMLSPLKAKRGKYAVFGVHDHYDKALIEFIKNMFKRKREYRKQGNIALIIKKLKSAGIEVLSNENRLIKINNGEIDSIEILGLDDPVIDKIDIGKAFSGLPSAGNKQELQNNLNYKKIYRKVFKLNTDRVHKINRKGILRLVLLHTPDTDSIINLALRKADIVFCGHTHGGQVRLPLIGAIISGCRLKTRFASGLFYLKKTVLFVTRGLGEGRYSRFRFYCQPEANLVRIYKIN